MALDPMLSRFYYLDMIGFCLHYYGQELQENIDDPLRKHFLHRFFKKTIYKLVNAKEQLLSSPHHTSEEIEICDAIDQLLSKVVLSPQNFYAKEAIDSFNDIVHTFLEVYKNVTNSLKKYYQSAPIGWDFSEDEPQPIYENDEDLQ